MNTNIIDKIMPSKKKYIIVIRHGPTTSNQMIDYNKFIKFISELVLYLKHFFIEKNIDIEELLPTIISSPYDRCIDTSKLIKSHLEILTNKNINLKVNDNLRRWDSNLESRKKSKKRGYTYGKFCFLKINNKSEHTINIYISHSSIIPYFIRGASNNDITKELLHTSSLSIIDGNTGDLIVFNKSFN